MAENESLTFGRYRAKRWDVLIAAVSNGASDEALVKLFEQQMRAGIKATMKEFAAYGVSLIDFVNAGTDQRRHVELLRLVHGHEYARHLSEAVMDSDGTPRDAYRLWHQSLSDRVVGQLRNGATSIDAPELCYRCETMSQYTSDEFERIAGRLADDPNWQPRKLPGPKVTSAVATKELLSVSLLPRTAP